jgi:hypothetical protein
MPLTDASRTRLTAVATPAVTTGCRIFAAGLGVKVEAARRAVTVVAAWAGLGPKDLLCVCGKEPKGRERRSGGGGGGEVVVVAAG